LAEIKLGTKAEPFTASPRRQLLTDDQVRAVVDAAFEVDPTGDFGRLVLLAAATGARFSQLANLIILDFQLENGRLMMPSSRKGKNRQPGARRAVPVGIDVMRRILPVTRRRSKHEPLLLRWSHRKTGGPGNWTKDKRQAWRRADEIDELWAKTVALAGIPADTVMYALRHSSIVRGLKKNLPVRLVAALHDTSVEMPLQNPTYKLRYQPCLTDAGRADDKLRRPRGPDGSQCCLFRVVQNPQTPHLR